MGLERNRGLGGGGGGNRQRIAATTNNDENFSLFDDQPSNQAGTSAAHIAASQTDALTAQVAQLTKLLSGLSSIVNKPQDF